MKLFHYEEAHCPGCKEYTGFASKHPVLRGEVHIIKDSGLAEVKFGFVCLEVKAKERDVK